MWGTQNRPQTPHPCSFLLSSHVTEQCTARAHTHTHTQKVKVSLPTPRNHVGEEVLLHPFLSSSLDGHEWLTSRSGRCALWKERWYLLNRRLGGPLCRSGFLWGKEKSLAPTWIETPYPSVRVGLDSLVGTATRYWLDGPGIKSRWGRYFPHLSRPALEPTQPPIQWVPGSFLEVKRVERGDDHPPPSSAEVKERVQLYLYSPFGPSWPVIGWPLPLPLPFSL